MRRNLSFSILIATIAIALTGCQGRQAKVEDLQKEYAKDDRSSDRRMSDSDRREAGSSRSALEAEERTRRAM